METATTDLIQLETNLTQLETYLVEVLKTAQPEAFDLRYLVPGIVGEVGEMFGHKAKAFWHGKPEAELNNELSYELGDVAWMTALLLHTWGERGVPNVETPLVGQHGDDWRALLFLTESLHHYWTGGHKAMMGHTAEKLWVFMADNAVALTGHDFQAVLDRNVAKLADRAARGKLKGNGDHR